MFYKDDDDNYNRCLGRTSISQRLNTLGNAQRLLLPRHSSALAFHQLQQQCNLHYISIYGTLLGALIQTDSQWGRRGSVSFSVALQKASLLMDASWLEHAFKLGSPDFRDGTGNAAKPSLIHSTTVKYTTLLLSLPLSCLDRPNDRQIMLLDNHFWKIFLN